MRGVNISIDAKISGLSGNRRAVLVEKLIFFQPGRTSPHHRFCDGVPNRNPL